MDCCKHEGTGGTWACDVKKSRGPWAAGGSPSDCRRLRMSARTLCSTDSRPLAMGASAWSSMTGRSSPDAQYVKPMHSYRSNLRPCTQSNIVMACSSFLSSHLPRLAGWRRINKCLWDSSCSRHSCRVNTTRALHHEHMDIHLCTRTARCINGAGLHHTCTSSLKRLHSPAV